MTGEPGARVNVPWSEGNVKTDAKKTALAF